MAARLNSFYLRYIASPLWEKKRKQFWSTRERMCARCSSTKNLHVHHMTYDRFTKELMSDLIGLCATCHELVHDTHRRHGGLLLEVTMAVVNHETFSEPQKRKTAPDLSRHYAPVPVMKVKAKKDLRPANQPNEHGFVPKHLRDTVLVKNQRGDLVLANAHTRRS